MSCLRENLLALYLRLPWRIASYSLESETRVFRGRQRHICEKSAFRHRNECSFTQEKWSARRRRGWPSVPRLVVNFSGPEAALAIRRTVGPERRRSYPDRLGTHMLDALVRSVVPSPWIQSVSVTYRTCSSGEKQRPLQRPKPSATALI